MLAVKKGLCKFHLFSALIFSSVRSIFNRITCARTGDQTLGGVQGGRVDLILCASEAAMLYPRVGNFFIGKEI